MSMKLAQMYIKPRIVSDCSVRRDRLCEHTFQLDQHTTFAPSCAVLAVLRVCFGFTVFNQFHSKSHEVSYREYTAMLK